VKNIVEAVRTFDVLPAEPANLGGRIATVLARVTSRRVFRPAAAIAAVAMAAALGLYWRDLPVPITGQRLGTLLNSDLRAPRPNSIAVLPFANMTGDPSNGYLGDGLAEELSHRLKRIPELHVAARTSAFAFKGKDLSVGAIAGQLGVSYVVEGSVRRQGDRVRVNANLVEVASGSSRWSNSYESASADIFAIESDIATRVLTALELVLGKRAAPSVSESRGDDIAAYDYYLQGLAYLRKPRGTKNLDAAEKLFTRVLDEEPAFARAQAGLCEVWVERYILDRVPAHVGYAEAACAKAQTLDGAAQEVHMAIGSLRIATGHAADATAEYRRALALVPNSPDALIGLAQALAADGKSVEAEQAFRRAITAQPSYAVTHGAYGSFLFALGRAKEATVAYERASIFAPDDTGALNNLGGAFLLMGDFEQAAEVFARSLALEPSAECYANLGFVEYYLGRFEKAGDMFRKAVEQAPADHRLWGNLADALHFSSRSDQALGTYRRALELADGELAINPNHAINHAVAAYYASRLDDRNRARRGVAMALSAAEDDFYVQYYVALAELGLGDLASSLAHAKRARDLGYPEILMQAAPELGEIRKSL
ncbi:MAG TPA: tetratricopeptide repeat protein, partial [Pirellulales bacterium]|nr:tetratricopeptide repeat protein [Pirellulales bacterium]